MRKEQSYRWNKLNLGTCFYPEHWDRALWKEDLGRMLSVGIQTIRILDNPSFDGIGPTSPVLTE